METLPRRPRRSFGTISGPQWLLVACNLLCGKKPPLFQILGLGREGEGSEGASTGGELNPCFYVSEYVAEIRNERYIVGANAPHCDTKGIDRDYSDSLSEATWLQHGPRPGRIFVGYVLLSQ